MITVGSTVVDRAFVNLYSIHAAPLMKVTRIGKTWPDGLIELEVSLTVDGNEVTELAWSDEVDVVPHMLIRELQP